MTVLRIHPDQIQAASDAIKARAAASGAVSQQKARLADLKRNQIRSDDERARLREQEEQDAAIRLLDGDDAAPKKSRRSNRLAKLDADAPALTAAIKQQMLRITEAASVASEADLPFVQAVLSIVGTVQGDALESTRKTLSALATPLSRLIAADQIRGALVGEQFQIPRGSVPPFRGLTVVQNFLNAVPDRLRSPALEEMALLDAAREVSTPIIDQIKDATA